MGHEIVLPKLGLSMENGKISKWLKNEGDRVTVGDLLCQVESDKAVVDIEAMYDGILHITHKSEDGVLEVGSIIGYILNEETKLSKDSFPEIFGDISSAEHSILKKSIHPDAISLINSVGINVSEIIERFPGKNISLSDVHQYIRELLESTPYNNNSGDRNDEIINAQPLTNIRKLIADKLTSSHLTTAAVTISSEVDASELDKFRNEHKSGPEKQTTFSYNSLFIKIVTSVLADYPIFNSSLQNNMIIHHKNIHIGLAVETVRGLVLAVIRNSQEKSLDQINSELEQLIPRVKAGKAFPDELSGGTFSISNMGQYDVTHCTHIINLPQCAVLGIGKMQQRVVPINKEIVIRPYLPISLTFDHRIVDGAPAGKFLQEIKNRLEAPHEWLVH